MSYQPALAEELVSGITDQDEPVDVVYLDFSNLIDSACHRLLGKKMVANGDPSQDNPLVVRVSKEQNRIE